MSLGSWHFLQRSGAALQSCQPYSTGADLQHSFTASRKEFSLRGQLYRSKIRRAIPACTAAQSPRPLNHLIHPFNYALPATTHTHRETCVHFLLFFFHKCVYLNTTSVSHTCHIFFSLALKWTLILLQIHTL